MNEAIVIRNIAGLKSKQEELSTLEDEVLYGMKVTILERLSDGWVKIRTHYRYEGLLMEKDLLFDADKISQWESKSHKTVLWETADVLAEERIQGACLITLSRGAQVICEEEPNEKGVVKVVLADGREGYMKDSFLGACPSSMYQDNYLTFEVSQKPKERMLAYVNNVLHMTEQEFRERVVKTALTYQGVQYRWGGKTSHGIDCSGLCGMAYMLNGIVIYRDAQIKEGFPVHEIAFEEKQPGDLLYFPGHIAMYIGEGKYVHSTNRKGSDGVVINSINPGDPDYREDLLKLLTKTGSIF